MLLTHANDPPCLQLHTVGSFYGLFLTQHSPIRLYVFSNPWMCARNVYLPKDKSPYAYSTSLFLCRPRGVSGFRKKLLSSGNNETIAAWRGDILQKRSLSASQQTPRFLWKPTVFSVFAAVQMRNPLWCDTTYWPLKMNAVVFMFVTCINSIKALFYYSKLMHTIIKS